MRIPLYSTDPKLWTLFRNNAPEGSDGSGAETVESVGSLILGVIGLAAMIVSATKNYEPDIEIPTVTFPPPATTTTTTTTSTKPAKK